MTETTNHIGAVFISMDNKGKPIRLMPETGIWYYITENERLTLPNTIKNDQDFTLQNNYVRTEVTYISKALRTFALFITKHINQIETKLCLYNQTKNPDDRLLAFYLINPKNSNTQLCRNTHQDGFHKQTLMNRYYTILHLNLEIQNFFD